MKLLKFVIFVSFLITYAIFASQTTETPIAPATPKEVEKKQVKETKTEVKKEKEASKQESKKSAENVRFHNVIILTDVSEYLKKDSGPITDSLALSICQQGYSIIASANLVANLLYFSKEKDERNSIDTKIVASLKDNFHKYVTKTGDFFLFIPNKGKLQDIKQDKESEILSGFKLTMLIPWKETKKIKPSDKLNLESLTSMFMTRKEGALGKWNIVLDGHGKYPDIDEKTGKPKIETGTIADWSIRQYREFIAFCRNVIDTNFFYCSFCYAGGYNSITPYLPNLINEKTEESKKRALEKTGKPEKDTLTGFTHPNFTIVVGSLTEATVTVDVAKSMQQCIKGEKIGSTKINYAGFFAILEKLSSKDSKATIFNDKELKEILTLVTPYEPGSKDDPYGISGLPQVMHPNTGQFIVLPMRESISVISNVTFKVRQLEKDETKKSFMLNNQEALLIYPKDITVPVIVKQSKAQAPAIISMIPGITLHKFKSLKINVTINAFIESFNALQIPYDKYFYCEELILGVGKEERYSNVLIKVQEGVATIIFTKNDLFVDIRKGGNSQSISIHSKKFYKKDSFLNALLTYFYSGSLAIENFFDKKVIFSMLSDKERKKLESYSEQLEKKLMNELQKEFPNLEKNPNELNKEGKTILHRATEMKNNDVAKKVMNIKGIDILQKSKEGKSAVALAREIGDKELLQIIVEPTFKKSDFYVTWLLSGGITKIDGLVGKFTLLTRAIASAILDGDTEAYKLLIELGANVNKADEYGYTPLTLAIDKGEIEIVRVLLDSGADITVPGKDGKLPSEIDTTSEIKDLLALHMKKKTTEKKDKGESKKTGEGKDK